MRHRNANAQETRSYSLHKWLVFILAYFILTFGLIIIGHGLGLIGTLQIVVLTLVVAILCIKSINRSLKLYRLAIGIILGIALTLAVGLIGFYKHVEVRAIFVTGGTVTTNRSFGSAVGNVFVDPAMFIAALAGYRCDGMATNCPEDKYYTGVVMFEGILLSGVLLGYGLNVHKLTRSPH